MSEMNRRTFLRLGFIAGTAVATAMLPLDLKTSEGFTVEKSSLPSIKKAEAYGMCGMGLHCGGGGGSCGYGLHCSGGGGKCGYGLNCSGS